MQTEALFFFGFQFELLQAVFPNGQQKKIWLVMYCTLLSHMQAFFVTSQTGPKMTWRMNDSRDFQMWTFRKPDHFNGRFLDNQTISYAESLRKPDFLTVWFSKN